MGRETYSSTGGVGGVGGMITYLGLAHILVYGCGGMGGVGGMITYLGLAHILVYGCGGMGGVGGMITYLGLAHILVWWDATRTAQKPQLDPSSQLGASLRLDASLFY